MPFDYLGLSHSIVLQSELRQAGRLGMLEEEKKDGIRSHLLKAATKIAATVTKIHKDYPYGNVHMSLMMGPLLIENGVPQFVPFSFIPLLQRRLKLF